MAEEYDVVIGLPSFNEEESIVNVLKAADAGCVKYFPGKKILLLNSDCLSDDNTKGVFLGTETQGTKEFHTTETRAAGKGVALKKVFERMLEVGAKIGMCFDTDLENFSEDWVGVFAHALEDGCDMVTPSYMRHRLDGTITNMLAYPVMCSVFGQNVRQPIGGDFGFSRRAVESYLKADWPEGTNHYGIDIFMTTSCVQDGLKFAEAELPPKVHKPSGPKLVQMVQQVISVLIYQINKSNVPDFTTVSSVKKYEYTSDGSEGSSWEVPAVSVDIDNLKAAAQELYKEKPEQFDQVPNTVVSGWAGAVEAGSLCMDEWYKLMFWCIGEYKKNADMHQVCTEILRLGYLLRAQSHLQEVKDLSNEEAEELVLKLASDGLKYRPAAEGSSCCVS